jgi:hypothetical protein
VQPMVVSIGKRWNDADARSRRNPYGTMIPVQRCP